MTIASFLGKKGGVGKSTNAHATAHGLTMLGIPAAYVLTDKRELLSDREPGLYDHRRADGATA